MGENCKLTRAIARLGQVRGARSGNAIVFHGIPYAAPAVGELRFTPPADASAWNGEFDATQPAPIAPQLPSRADAVMGPIVAAQDEDCLTLTIWTPESPVQDAPVLVWLHGGGFLTGGGALPWYDGALLSAERGIVVVGVNYRLGVLGFLDVPGQVPANLALLDQRAALEWVQQHIAVFGGDPRRVTVCGESGGAHNIVSLLSTGEPPAFNRAILQSAPLGIGIASPEESRERAAPFLTALGLDAAQSDLAERLRELPLDRILAAQGAAGARLARPSPGDLRPTVLPAEGSPHSVKSADYVSAAAAGAADHGVEIMIGWTRDEAQFFLGKNPTVAAMDEAELVHLACECWGTEAPGLLQALHTHLPDASPGELFSAAVTEKTFRRPSLSFAEAVADRGGRVFVYQFDWASPDASLGACHCLDLPFVFGNREAWAGSALLAGADAAMVDDLSADVRGRWAGFAAAGDPGFPAWSATRHPIAHIDTECWVEHSDPSDTLVSPDSVPEFTGSKP